MNEYIIDSLGIGAIWFVVVLLIIWAVWREIKKQKETEIAKKQKEAGIAKMKNSIDWYAKENKSLKKDLKREKELASYQDKIDSLYRETGSDTYKYAKDTIAGLGDVAGYLRGVADTINNGEKLNKIAATLDEFTSTSKGISAYDIDKNTVKDLEEIRAKRLMEENT